MGVPKIFTEEGFRIALDVYLTLWREQGGKLDEKTLGASPYFQKAVKLIDNLRACQDKPGKAFKRSEMATSLARRVLSIATAR